GSGTRDVLPTGGGLLHRLRRITDPAAAGDGAVPARRTPLLTALPVVVLMDLSRPIGVAFSFFMLLHLIDRFVHRKSDPYPAAEVVRSWTLGVLSCAAALIHPVHAWLATGSMTAYTDTEAAWHTGE